MTMSQDRRYSFEFFPTKTDAGHEKLIATARQLASYNPDFFSCTYGAGGSTRDRTINTVLQLESEVKIPAAPHLSCVGDSKADLRSLLSQYKARSEEHTSELQSLMRISYAVFCLKKKHNTNTTNTKH